MDISFQQTGYPAPKLSVKTIAIVAMTFQLNRCTPYIVNSPQALAK